MMLKEKETNTIERHTLRSTINKDMKVAILGP